MGARPRYAALQDEAVSLGDGIQLLQTSRHLGPGSPCAFRRTREGGTCAGASEDGCARTGNVVLTERDVIFASYQNQKPRLRDTHR